jgi:hypothetical protein
VGGIGKGGRATAAEEMDGAMADCGSGGAGAGWRRRARTALEVTLGIKGVTQLWGMGECLQGHIHVAGVPKVGHSRGFFRHACGKGDRERERELQRGGGDVRV